MRAMCIPLAEVEIIPSQARLQKYITAKIPFSAKHVYKPDYEVLVFREKQNIKCTGPFNIIRIEGSQAFIYRNGTTVQYSLSQFRPFLREEAPTTTQSSVLYQLGQALSNECRYIPIPSWQTSFQWLRIHMRRTLLRTFTHETLVLNGYSSTTWNPKISTDS